MENVKGFCIFKENLSICNFKSLLLQFTDFTGIQFFTHLQALSFLLIYRHSVQLHAIRYII